MLLSFTCQIYLDKKINLVLHRTFLKLAKVFKSDILGSFKQPLHDKFKLANSCWQTQVGVCVNGTKTGGKHVCKLLASNRNAFADCFYAVHTHQLEFATQVCQL